MEAARPLTLTRSMPSGPAGIGSIAGIPDGTPVFGQVSFTAPANAGGGVPQNTYNIVGRVDYNFGAKTQMFFRYVNYDEVDESGGIFASPYPQYNVGQTQKTRLIYSV